jgi:hypothetical protein
MRMFRSVELLTLVVVASAASAGAQSLAQPLRSAPPPDADRTTQQLTITARALGGYDDHLASRRIAVLPSSATDQGGYTGHAAVALRYRRGRPARWVSLDGSAYLLSYSNVHIGSPVGGQIRAAGTTTLGRSAQVEISQQVRTDPYVSFGAFGPLRPDLGPDVGPDTDPTNGLRPERSWGSISSASLNWRLTPRNTVSTGYDYVRNEYIGEAGFDNRTHAAQLSFLRSLTRTVAARASYRYADTLLVEPQRNESRPLAEHTLEAGLDHAKALSPTRRMQFSAGAGATHVETVSRFGGRPLEYWTPSGHASARADIARTWAVSAAYRRGVAFLDGITPESFLADVVLLQTEGNVSRRVELMFSSGYSNGKQRTQLVSGRYDTFTLTAEARVAIARPWALILTYDRNEYRLFSFPAPPVGPPPRYARNAIRVGMTYSFSQSSARTERPARPGRTEN